MAKKPTNFVKIKFLVFIQIFEIFLKNKIFIYHEKCKEFFGDFC